MCVGYPLRSLFYSSLILFFFNSTEYLASSSRSFTGWPDILSDDFSRKLFNKFEEFLLDLLKPNPFLWNRVECVAQLCSITQSLSLLCAYILFTSFFFLLGTFLCCAVGHGTIIFDKLIFMYWLNLFFTIWFFCLQKD